MKKIHLLVIDPQRDFCCPDGALFVSGADKDMERLAVMVDRIYNSLEDIHCTLDQHHLVDVAHPIFWKDSSGNPPKPFTIISSKDVVDGVWTPREVGLTRRMIEYVRELEKGGKYPLCVWPEHCLIGSLGATVTPVLMGTFFKWERTFSMVNYVSKGSNIYTEHYSAIKAEVPDPSDPTTQINTSLISTIMEADEVVIAGEAGSHCLANTVRDIANGFGDDSYVQKLTLLTDATSPVPGFEKLQDDFINEMVKRGMKLSTTTTFLS